MHAHALQQRAARIAIGNHAEPLLHFTDVVAQVEIQMAVEIGHLVTKVAKLSLKRDALVAGWLKVILGPRGADRAEAVDPFGRGGSGERVGVRVIVLLDGDEISGDEKSGSRGAAREEQNRIAR